MRLEVKDSLQLFKNATILSGKVGQFLDAQLDEGLMIYNLDVQGLQIRAEHGKFIFQYTLYGDLNNGIGLSVDDVNHFSIQRKLNGESKIGVSMLIAQPPYAPLENFFNVNLYASKVFSNSHLYAQVAYRDIDPNFLSRNSLKQSAFLAGIRVYSQHKKSDHSFKAEARHYGFLFNILYYNWDTAFYRKPATDIYSNYANTVGLYLYPLRKFDTPFSQWAVFTEYQGSHVWSVSVAGNSTWHLSDKFDAFIDYDLNYIYSHLDKVFNGPGPRSSSFLYPFLNTGLAYKPSENTFIKTSLANKAMNLDINYPTFYLLKRPCLQFSILASFK
jgi:hypothetical protein